MGPPLPLNKKKKLNFLDNGCKQLRCLQKTRMKLHVAIEDTITMLCAKEVKLICLIFPSDFNLHVCPFSRHRCQRKFEIYLLTSCTF